MNNDGMKQNVYICNTLLKALCKNNRDDGAHKLLVENAISYMTLVFSLCRQGKVEEARQFAGIFEPIVPLRGGHGKLMYGWLF